MNVPSDAVVANNLIALYAGNAANFTAIDLGSVDGICWAHKQRADGCEIYLRGSVTMEDWHRDFLALPNFQPFTHSALGPVHSGFLLGLHELWDEIKRKTKGPWVVAGHSLGAGRAAILAGIMMSDGKPPLRRVCFGEPKAGFAKLAKLVSAIPAASYRNGDDKHHDLVTDVPFTFPPLNYVHPCDLTHVCAPPDEVMALRYGVFSWHSMNLYAKALLGV